MHERKVTKSDIPKLEAMFSKQGIEYELPDFTKLFAKRAVVDSDRPVAALGARLTTELFLLLDRDWETPRWRLEAIKMLMRGMTTELGEKGIEDVHLWCPPELDKPFGRRLMRDFAFVKSTWPSYMRLIHAR